MRARTAKSMAKLSHYDKKGRVRMVDVSAKPSTSRTAQAHAFIRMKKSPVSAIRRIKNPKGNPLEIARIAGITAAKRTSELIPLCHPLALTHIDVLAASVAALTIYDMCKALEPGMEITEVFVVKKAGGRSGAYVRPGKRG